MLLAAILPDSRKCVSHGFAHAKNMLCRDHVMVAAGVSVSFSIRDKGCLVHASLSVINTRAVSQHSDISPLK